MPDQTTFTLYRANDGRTVGQWQVATGEVVDLILGMPVETIEVVPKAVADDLATRSQRSHRRALQELLFRVKPILASFRSTDVHVADAQIEKAWSAYQAACEVIGGPFSRPESPIKGQRRG